MNENMWYYWILNAKSCSFVHPGKTVGLMRVMQMEWRYAVTVGKRGVFRYHLWAEESRSTK